MLLRKSQRVVNQIMMKVKPQFVIRLMGALGSLLEMAMKIPKPESVDNYILTPEDSESKYFVVVNKAGFKTKEQAEDFLKFNDKLDELFNE